MHIDVHLLYNGVTSLCFRRSWIPTCAKLFWERRDLWEHLVPADDTDSTELAQEFFACVAAVMSFQLRGMVTNSLADFLEFFQIHMVCAHSFTLY